MGTERLLYKESIDVADNITIHIPKIGWVLENETEYYKTVDLICATPMDMIVELSDAGIDCRNITDFELFLLLFNEIKSTTLEYPFGQGFLDGFVIAKKDDSNDFILYDKDNDIVIDRVIHARICHYLRAIHGFERNSKKPGNDEAMRYIVERMRKKKQRAAKMAKTTSQIEDIIVSLVNTPEFKYDYSTVLDLTISQFTFSIKQIVKRIEYSHIMTACYSGTIKSESLNMDEICWIGSNKN